MTLQERHVRRLLALGYVPCEIRSRKYICMCREGKYVFLGFKGAYRVNDKPTITEAISISTANAQLVMWEKKQKILS